MIRVVLPAHLRTLARIDGEVELDVAGQVTQCSVLDALETRYPVLRGTIRDQNGGQRRAFIVTGDSPSAVARRLGKTADVPGLGDVTSC
jgi:molybdopterin converting factor small subunit